MPRSIQKGPCQGRVLLTCCGLIRALADYALEPRVLEKSGNRGHRVVVDVGGFEGDEAELAVHRAIQGRNGGMADEGVRQVDVRWGERKLREPDFGS